MGPFGQDSVCLAPNSRPSFRAIGYASIRRTEVPPICNRRAISHLLLPARYSFLISAACRAAVAGRPRRLPFCRAWAKPRRRRPVPRPSHARLAWSGRAPRSARRNLHRGGPVPREWQADLSPISPSGPAATPTRDRSRGGAPLPATSPAVAVRMRRRSFWARQDSLYYAGAG